MLSLPYVRKLRVLRAGSDVPLSEDCSDDGEARVRLEHYKTPGEDVQILELDPSKLEKASQSA